MAEISAAMEAVRTEWIKSGKLKEAYHTADMKHVIFMAEVSSPEEWARMFMGYPGFFYMEIDELTPLVEYETSVKISREIMQKAMKK